MPTDPLLPPALDVPCPSGRRRRRWLETALALLVALGACSSGSSSTKSAERGGTARALPDEDPARLRTPGAAATLSDLTRLGQLEQLFDEHRGSSCSSHPLEASA
jgi:hypothetical protein